MVHKRHNDGYDENTVCQLSDDGSHFRPEQQPNFWESLWETQHVLGCDPDRNVATLDCTDVKCQQQNPFRAILIKEGTHNNVIIVKKKPCIFFFWVLIVSHRLGVIFTHWLSYYCFDCFIFYIIVLV